MFAPPLKNLERFGSHFLFWTWSALFAALTYFGFVPLLFSDLAGTRFLSHAPVSFLFCTALIIVTPALSLAIGIAILRKTPRRLVQLLYTVEAPVLLAAVVRITVLNDLNRQAAVVLAGLLLGTLAQLLSLTVDPKRLHRIRYALYAAQSIGVVMAAVLFANLVVFMIPALYNLPSTIPGLDTPLWLFLKVIVGGALSLVLILFPVGFIWGHLVDQRRLFRGFVRVDQQLQAWLIPIVAIAAFGGLVELASIPTVETLDRIETPPANIHERRQRLDDAGAIHEALLNAYLWRSRYVDRVEDVNVVGSLYRDFLSEDGAQVVQNFFSKVMRPFLYEGTRYDHTRAHHAYAEFFDESINRRARVDIRRAFHSNIQRSEMPAGLLDADERPVFLAAQDIEIRPDTFGAEIEVFDTYESRSDENTEVILHFSLPSTAVVTGLWLNDHTPSKADAFASRVSPRGAAKKTYEREVQRRVDPALLEQIGPRQYRLRVFPIPANKKMYVWMTYRAIQEHGRWPLPQLFEATNVFWNASTVRRVDGKRAPGSESWRAPSVVATDAPPTGSFRWPIGETNIVATPYPADEELTPRGGRHYAVVLDRSYSMNSAKAGIEATFDWLRATVYPKSDVDLYLASAPNRGEPPELVENSAGYDVTRELYYGRHDAPAMLAQAAALAFDADVRCPVGRQGLACYDAVILLTDRGGIETESGSDLSWPASTPLWIVHVGRHLGVGYADAVTQAVQRSGGGVATHVREPFRTFALAERNPDAFIGFGGGYAWTLDKQSRAPEASGLAPLAARQFIHAALQTMDITQTTTLDRIHRVALKHRIVTAYSSMIVLVDEPQHRDLDADSQGADRFQRGDSVPSPLLDVPVEANVVTGTPEPEEWALLLLGGLLLLGLHRDRLKMVCALPR